MTLGQSRGLPIRVIQTIRAETTRCGVNHLYSAAAVVRKEGVEVGAGVKRLLRLWTKSA
jgi:hypothetical protein